MTHTWYLSAPTTIWQLLHQYTTSFSCEYSNPKDLPQPARETAHRLLEELLQSICTDTEDMVVLPCTICQETPTAIHWSKGCLHGQLPPDTDEEYTLLIDDVSQLEVIISALEEASNSSRTLPLWHCCDGSETVEWLAEEIPFLSLPSTT